MSIHPKAIYELTANELKDLEDLFLNKPFTSGSSLPQSVKIHLLDSAIIFGEPSEQSLLAFIGVLAEQPGILNSLSALEDKVLPNMGISWGKKFLLEWLKQFRQLVCQKSPEFKAEYSRLGSATQAVILVLVPSLMKTLGITEPHAFSLAVALFLGLSKVTKHAICTATDQEIEERLSQVTTENR